MIEVPERHQVAEPLTAPISASGVNVIERRIPFLDTLRGLASVQVLLSHSMMAFFIAIFFAAPSSGTLAGYLAATPIYFFLDGASAVCVFFVLSGYVLTPVFAHSRASNGAIICSRFLRLAIPAIAGCAFSAILFQFFGADTQPAGTLAGSWWLAENWRPSTNLWIFKDAVVNGILLGFQGASILQWFGLSAASLAPMPDSYVTPLWTLSIEFYGSLLVLLLARVKSRTLLILATIVLCRSYLFCFIAGHIAARFNLAGRQPVLSWYTAASAAAIGLAVCLFSHFRTPHAVVYACMVSVQFLAPCPLAKPDYLMRVYGATLLTIGIMQCAPIRIFLQHKRLSALGRLSFPIYLTHWPIIFGVGSFTLLTLAPWTGARAARLLAMIAGIVTTIVAARCFEPIDRIALRVSRASRK